MTVFLGHRRFHRVFNDQLVDLDQFGRLFNDARLWIPDMPLAG